MASIQWHCILWDCDVQVGAADWRVTTGKGSGVFLTPWWKLTRSNSTMSSQDELDSTLKSFWLVCLWPAAHSQEKNTNPHQVSQIMKLIICWWLVVMSSVLTSARSSETFSVCFPPALLQSERRNIWKAWPLVELLSLCTHLWTIENVPTQQRGSFLFLYGGSSTQKE